MAGEVIVPGCEWRPSTNVRPFITRYDALIYHTRGGGGDSDHYHFDVKGDGHSIQYHDLRRQSIASIEANPFSIAIVGSDTGPPFPLWSGQDVPNYTEAQVEEIIRISSYVLEYTDIPARPLMDSCISATNQGIGWHRLGIDGNFPEEYPFYGRKPGCQRWSSSFGKGCPGPRRITTICNRIIPALQGADMTKIDDLFEPWYQNHIDFESGQPGFVHPKDQDMVARIKEMASRLGAFRNAPDILTPIHNKVEAVRLATDTLEATVGRIEAKIDQLFSRPPGGGGGLTEAQTRAIVREELDKTKLGV